MHNISQRIDLILQMEQHCIMCSTVINAGSYNSYHYSTLYYVTNIGKPNQIAHQVKSNLCPSQAIRLNGTFIVWVIATKTSSYKKLAVNRNHGYIKSKEKSLKVVAYTCRYISGHAFNPC